MVSLLKIRKHIQHSSAEQFKRVVLVSTTIVCGVYVNMCNTEEMDSFEGGTNSNELRKT